MKLIRLAAITGAIWYLRDAHRRQQLVNRVKGLLHRGDQAGPGAERRLEGHASTMPAPESRASDVAAGTPSG